MDDSTDRPPIDALCDALLAGDEVRAQSMLTDLASTTAEDRKVGIRSLRNFAEDHPAAFEPVADSLGQFLDDDERAVRLTTAKLFVTIATGAPVCVLSAVEPLAARLADEDEFYFVRARSAEALGYAALADPDTVATPETVAELRIGLEFEEPEVTEKLAKALAHVAIANPRRLRHQVGKLADHLDDEQELVRYHLCTALVAVGSAHPAALADGRDALIDRLDDDCGYVRGRAVEALGQYARAVDDSGVEASDFEPLVDDDSSFVATRGASAVSALDSGASDPSDEIGTIEAIRESTDEIAAEIAAPETDGECPHCGLELPEAGPPMCPRCGAPR